MPVTSSVPMATLPTLASLSMMSNSCARTSGVAVAIFGPRIGMITELAPPAMKATMWMKNSSAATNGDEVHGTPPDLARQDARPVGARVSSPRDVLQAAFSRRGPARPAPMTMASPPMPPWVSLPSSILQLQLDGAGSAHLVALPQRNSVCPGPALRDSSPISAAAAEPVAGSSLEAHARAEHARREVEPGLLGRAGEDVDGATPERIDLIPAAPLAGGCAAGSRASRTGIR